jgi:hypothetical protein
MPRPTYYSPVIGRFLVSALYHEAKKRGVPMTQLTNALLTEGLKNSHGWNEAASAKVAEEPPRYGPKKAA